MKVTYLQEHTPEWKEKSEWEMSFANVWGQWHNVAHQFREANRALEEAGARIRWYIPPAAEPAPMWRPETQERGDAVAHGNANAADLARAIMWNH